VVYTSYMIPLGEAVNCVIWQVLSVLSPVNSLCLHSRVSILCKHLTSFTWDRAVRVLWTREVCSWHKTINLPCFITLFISASYFPSYIIFFSSFPSFLFYHHPLFPSSLLPTISSSPYKGGSIKVAKVFFKYFIIRSEKSFDLIPNWCMDVYMLRARVRISSKESH
jgi:hypothetical protein